MTDAPHPASIAQITAALPHRSTWLSANAGSGKTRVLIDRVARLLLDGVEPQHILCLTYTKAAATEMQNRLFKRLGEWAMKDSDALRADLAELGAGAGLDADRLALARQLFARAIETPGGLRIQTIHSFCATLLRRYPLEAGVSPGFAEMDDRTARQMRDDILQEMADGLAPEAVAGLAELTSNDAVDAVLTQICGNAEAFERVLDRAGALLRFGLPADTTQDSILARVFLGDESRLMGVLVAALDCGSSTDLKHAARLRGLDFKAPDLGVLQELEGMFLFGETAKAPFGPKIDSYSSKATRAALGLDMVPLNALMGRVADARAVRISLLGAEKMLALHQFGRVFLSLYAERKAERGLLDFDDLIRKAAALLRDPALAAWVLFRLDGGIDHILVDEAQDTSPRQWDVIASLCAEFTAGDGARDTARTLFVVGDKKQSIYSFQGADLSAFDARRDDFVQRFADAAMPMQQLSLDYSFRSSSAILDVVDATFGDDFPEALGDAPRHIAFAERLAGRVDLWPLLPPSESVKDENGWDPVDLVAEGHHTAELADRVAEHIARMIRDGARIPLREGGDKAVTAGDFLILVQRRAEVFSQIMRACKERGLPIAGADRMKLGEELAVKDLKALLSFLATPEDDLSLAAALRSPLLGWSEDALFRLAHGRKSYLWQALREAGESPARAILDDLRMQVDYLRPYELLERVLTLHKGRQNLLTRLGAEAEDAIDELLVQALVYEQTDVPSLTGFLVWLEGDEVEVKRQLGGEGGVIRVMTVHGAKGLEANIVILPDTADRKDRGGDNLMVLDDGVAVWSPPRNERPAEIAAKTRQQMEKARQERLRLLYVALTRARSWLIVCGAGEAKTESDGEPKPRAALCWHLLVAEGLTRLSPDRLADGTLRYQRGDWPADGRAEAVSTAAVALPEWVTRAPPAAPASVKVLSPSDLGGEKALAGEGADSDTAMARGTVLHSLLESMPAIDPSLWPELAQSLTPAGFDAAELLAEAAGVLSAPDLAPLFRADALREVSVTGNWNGVRLSGQVDLLLIEPDHVRVIDFKSNRQIPVTAAQVPEGILRQMGAYAHILGQIYPDRPVETAILWTAAPKLMRLDANIVTMALARATTS